MKTFKFYQITDLHLYAAKEIGSCGKNFKFKCETDQKCMAESPAIVDAAFEKVAADPEREVIIISGDLSFDGEQQSHQLLLTKLAKLKAAGKKVYVTFATHDFNMHARGYNDSGTFDVPKYTREQLRQLYNDYGWNEAVSEHIPSYSYAVVPQEGVRILMLNDDGDGKEFCGYDETQLKWIEQQTVAAKENGEKVIAVTHHPLLPPSLIYPIYSHRNMLGGYETTAPFMADLGIRYVFTGHTHMQSISYIDTPKGNRLYHINTGSIIAYPAPIRQVTLTDEYADVKTVTIDSFDWDLGGLSVEDYMKEHFLHMLKDIFYTMENDIERFKILADGFSLEADTVEKLKLLITLLGKVVNRLTFKTLGRMMLVGSKIDPFVAKLKVKDFLLDVLLQMYSGEGHFTPDTVEYQSFMPIIERLSKVIKLKDSEGNPVSLVEIIDDLLYNTGEYDNNNAVLY